MIPAKPLCQQSKRNPKKLLRTSCTENSPIRTSVLNANFARRRFIHIWMHGPYKVNRPRLQSQSIVTIGLLNDIRGKKSQLSLRNIKRFSILYSLIYKCAGSWENTRVVQGNHDAQRSGFPATRVFSQLPKCLELAVQDSRPSRIIGTTSRDAEGPGDEVDK